MNKIYIKLVYYNGEGRSDDGEGESRDSSVLGQLIFWPKALGSPGLNILLDEEHVYGIGSKFQ